MGGDPDLWNIDVIGIQELEEQRQRGSHYVSQSSFDQTVQRKDDGSDEVSLPRIGGNQPVPVSCHLAEYLGNTTKRLPNLDMFDHCNNV
ncbi:hypothetical protein LAZ67_2005837 [Cordylochernes scorpioides]|uniref:Uncharacterized protein n=1 Tax=Cordylochernes scorpioides TaxID=51811 RepID=A0ABY6K827_9ARAC|nr:hypothetical protein LAZ67_2005837 [Cordylochernes scorpioides]